MIEEPMNNRPAFQMDAVFYALETRQNIWANFYSADRVKHQRDCGVAQEALRSYDERFSCVSNSTSTWSWLLS
jgi:hypothetical protein